MDICPQLEFKSWDDAWYDVSVEMKGSKLRVHYEGFADEEDEILRRGDIESIEALRSRLRFSSRQLQDHQCGEVKKGMNVCASCSTEADDTRFFDAVVQQVCKAKHQLVDGEEECTCTFKVMWQAGPSAYTTTFVSCENICLLTLGSIESHPTIKAFVKLVQEKISWKVRYLGRNPLKRKVTNMKGTNSTNYKDKQVEQGVSGGEVESNHITVEHGRVRNVSNTCNQDVTIDGLKNKIKSVSPSNNKVDDNTHHLAYASSQSRKMEKTNIDGLNTTMDVVFGSKVLFEKVSSSNELENVAPCESYMDRQRRIYGYYPHSEEVDNTHNLASISSQSRKMNTSIDELNATEDVDSEVLHQQVSSSNELENIALCGSYVDKQRRIYGFYPHNENDIKVTKIIDENILSARNDNEEKETCFNSMRKKEKFSLDLNSMPTEIEPEDLVVSPGSFDDNILSQGLCQSSHPHLGSLSSTSSYASTGANNINRKDNDNDGFIKIQRPYDSGWLEEKDCTISQNENIGYSIVNNIFGNLDSMNANVENKGSKLHEDHLPTPCGEMKRHLPTLVKDKWDGGFQCESINEQLSMEENKKDQESTKDGRKVLLASFWGKHRRQNYARRVNA